MLKTGFRKQPARTANGFSCKSGISLAECAQRLQSAPSSEVQLKTTEPTSKSFAGQSLTSCESSVQTEVCSQNQCSSVAGSQIECNAAKTKLLEPGPTVSLADMVVKNSEQPTSHPTECERSHGERALASLAPSVEMLHITKRQNRTKKCRVSVQHLLENLTARPSTFVLTLGYHTKRLQFPSDKGRITAYRHFSYAKQSAGCQPGNLVCPSGLKKIIPFDFSSPSPDDIVKEKQKKAFSS